MQTLPLSERTLMLAANAAAGEAPPADVVPLAEELVNAARQGREQFRIDSEGNPEISGEDAARTLEAMDGYVQHLQELLDKARAGSASELQEPLKSASECLLKVREAQARHAAATCYGPGMHPFLNRVLHHLEVMSVDNTSDKRHTLALLDDWSRFEEEVGEQVGGIDDPGLLERAQQGMQEIKDVCSEFRTGLESNFAGVSDRAAHLKSLRDALVAGSDKVAEGLGAQFEYDLQVGRTPYPPVNLVLAATDRLITGGITRDQFLEAVWRCHTLVGERFGAATEESVVEAAREVQASLERLVQLPPELDAARVVSERDALRDATENLAMFVVVLSSDDEVLDVVSGEGLAGGGAGGRGLPLMFSSLLQAGDMFLAGEASKEDMLDAIKTLEETHGRFASQLGASRESAKRTESVQACLEHMRVAVESLHEMVDRKGGRGALEKAEHELTAANEALKSMGK